MEAIARSQFARYSHRKVGQVLGQIRGKTVAHAVNIVPFIPRVARVLVQKTLKSAVANAGKPADLNKFYVTEAWANNGPALKRVRPMAMGARAMYKRKTCHLTIKISDEPRRK